MKKRLLCLVLLICLLTSYCAFIGACNKNTVLDSDKPTEITVWNYYTGAQLEAFNAQVEKFNATRGKELGIVVKASSEGSISDLENNVIAAANKEVNAKEVPNIFAAYADTAYKIDKMGLVADISSYFTDAEKAEYIDGYLKEGDLDGNGSLKIFPIAKSTEIFMLNTTDWNKFTEAYPEITFDDLATIEGVTATAEKYYNWTLETSGEGKALFGRDAMANYMFIGAMQLGTELLTIDKDGKVVLNFDEQTIRTLWDNYYVPYIKGHFSSSGRFRSDDVGTGNIISFVGSSTSTSFFPIQVLIDDDNSYKIGHTVLEVPKFADGEAYAIQQGAGMVVTKGTDAQVLASVEFLKWFTDVEQNIKFANASGYLPVKKAANDLARIREVLGDDIVENDALEVSLNTVNGNSLYTVPATENGSEVRSILENSMADKAKDDRALILEDIKNGTSYEDAVAKYNTNENFNSWYDTTKATLKEKFS